MAADNQDQGYVPYNPNKPLQQTPAAPPAKDPNDQGYVPLAVQKQSQGQTSGGQTQQPTGPGWGIDWSKGGEVTMPQSAQDWSTIAAQNSLMGLYPGLTAQAAEARKRLDPVTAASADVAGGIVSPTTLLNAVPFVGPELAGGVHEGVKSYAEGNDWKTIGEDTLGGAGWGLAGHGAAALVPKVLPQLSRQGLNAGLAYGAHKLFGGWAGGDMYKEGAGLLGLYGLTDRLGEKVAEGVKTVAGTPATRQAIQNLILGGGSAFRQAAGPYDQWIPGQ